MMKALILLADGVEEIEAVTPVDLLRRAGIDVTSASISTTVDINGSHNITIKADTLLKNVKDNTYDILILPGGGGGTERLGNSKEVMTLIKKQYDSGKYVAAICAAPTILPKAGIEGHVMTCYTGMEGAFKPELFSTNRVVVSGKVITSRSLATAIDFSLEIINTLLGSARMQEIKKEIVY